MKNLFLFLFLIALSSPAEYALVRDGEVAKTWDKYPSKYPDKPTVNGVQLERGESIVKVKKFTVPEGRIKIPATKSYSITNGVVSKSWQTETTEEKKARNKAERQAEKERVLLEQLGLTLEDYTELEEEYLTANLADVWPLATGPQKKWIRHQRKIVKWSIDQLTTQFDEE